jgi:hypothetical protein
MRINATSWKNGNNGARKAGKKRERDEGVSQDRVQAEQTNGLRARGPFGREFRCGPAPERPPAARKYRAWPSVSRCGECPRHEG